jgi:hypothetical protein
VEQEVSADVKRFLFSIYNQVSWIYDYYKSDEGQDASLRIEIGDPGIIDWQYSNIVGAPLLPV